MQPILLALDNLPVNLYQNDHGNGMKVYRKTITVPIVLFILNLLIIVWLGWLTNELINSTGVSPLQSIKRFSNICPSVNNVSICLGRREISPKQILASWLVIIAWGSYLIDLLVMSVALYKKKVYHWTIPFVILLGLRTAGSIAVLFILKPWLPTV